MTNAISTSVTPSATPWLQQPSETPAEWMCFLGWALTPNRAHRALTREASTLAARQSWWTRAAQLDHRLAPPKSLNDVTRDIALDAVTILHIELGALAAESRAVPGRQSLKDLTALLGLVAQLGGFKAIAKTANEHTPTDEVDYASLTTEDLETLTRASQILATAKKAPR